MVSALPPRGAGVGRRVPGVPGPSGRVCRGSHLGPADGRAGTLERYEVPYPNGIDEEGEIAIEYGVKGLPEKFFIDQQGFIAKKFVGPTSESDLREALDELLKAGLSAK